MEEKIETLSGLLQGLKGQKVFIYDKSSPESELKGKYVIVGETQGDRCIYWTVGGGKTVNMYGVEEYIEPGFVEISAYIGNIAAITRYSVDYVKGDIPENIIYEDKEMLNVSKGKTL